MEAIRLEEELVRFYKNSEVPENLSESIIYSISAGGKRIRPLLFLELLTGFGQVLNASHYKLAAAIEMIHTGSLIHDDLPAMDNDDYRRGKLTNHKVFGEDLAILAGDGLFLDPYCLLAESEFPAEMIVRLVSELSRASGSLGMVAGQAIDMASEKKDISLTELNRLHALKTGRMLTFPFVAAAIILEKDTESFRAIGDKLGLAFQIRDDILDATANFSEIGKTPGKDLLEEKSTYVKVLGLEASKKILEESLSEVTEALLSLKDFNSEQILMIVKGLSL